MDNAILDLIKRSAAIPSMPQVAARFLEIIQDPDFEYRDVVELLSTDPGMTGEILRLANSPLFGVTRKITSLAQALTLLGLKRIRSLVLGRYIVDNIDKKKPAVIKMGYYWRRSLTTAVLANHLAERIDPKLREEAFTAGLLADIGIIILDETLPDRFKPIALEYRPQGRTPLWDLEHETLSVTHGAVSALVLEDWRLPDSVCAAVARHSDPPAKEADACPPLGRVIRAADSIGKFLCEEPTDLDRVGAGCIEASAEIAVESQSLARILSEIEPQIAEFASILRIEAGPSQIYGALAEKLRELSAAPTY